MKPHRIDCICDACYQARCEARAVGVQQRGSLAAMSSTRQAATEIGKHAEQSAAELLACIRQLGMILDDVLAERARLKQLLLTFAASELSMSSVQGLLDEAAKMKQEDA